MSVGEAGPFTLVLAALLRASLLASITERAATCVEGERPIREIESMGWGRLTLALVGRALLRPRLAVDLLRVAWRFRVRGWYRRWPFLPIPSRTYVRWRMHTAYGSYDAVPPLEDVVRYARWTGEGP